MLKMKPWIELEIMKYKLTAYFTESMTWCIVLQPRCYSMQLSTRPIKLMISHFVYCTTHSLLSWCSGDIILLLHMMQNADVYCPAYAVLHQRVLLTKRNYVPCARLSCHMYINTLRPRQNGRHFADEILKCISWIKMYELWLIFHWSLFRRVISTIFQHWFR